MSVDRPGLAVYSGKEIFVGRYNKPGYVINGSNSIKVTATANSPAYFVIGGDVRAVTSDLVCRLSTTGAGGLIEGSLAASKMYYLYAVISDSEVKLVADTRDPNTGVRGFAVWTYLGGFSTNATSTLNRFASIGGKYMSMDIYLQQVSHTGDANYTLKDLLAPTTAKLICGYIIAGGAAVAAANIGGSSSTTGSNFELTKEVAGVQSNGYTEIAVEEGNKAYIRTSNAGNTVYWRHCGWIEDPSEWL